MDTLLGILRRAALINESRPDRGYAALDRTREFGARVAHRVGGLKYQRRADRGSCLGFTAGRSPLPFCDPQWPGRSRRRPRFCCRVTGQDQYQRACAAGANAIRARAAGDWTPRT